MSRWWLFPPRTRELQLDEKWAFVYRKQKHCDAEDPDDHHKGDCWDHVAFDAEHRLVLGVVCGKRSATPILKLMRRVKRQLQDRPPRLITSDQYASYATVLRLLWLKPPAPRPCGQDPPRRAGARSPSKRPKLNYAMVCKHRHKGRVVWVKSRVVLGTWQSVRRALKHSSVSMAINTSFLERHNATDRHRNARKARSTYRFSKDWLIHEALTYFSYYSYNFCWPVRTLRRRRRRQWQACTPAMSAGLADHVWPLSEWLSRPVPALAS